MTDHSRGEMTHEGFQEYMRRLISKPIGRDTSGVMGRVWSTMSTRALN